MMYRTGRGVSRLIEASSASALAAVPVSTMMGPRSPTCTATLLPAPAIRCTLPWTGIAKSAAGVAPACARTGTRVMTVKGGTCGVPTLLIEKTAKPD